jgi:hypothetical protein
MKLRVLFATSDQTLRTFIGLRKVSLIPPSMISDGYWAKRGVRFDVCALEINANMSSSDFAEMIHTQAEQFDAVVLLIEDACHHLAEGVRDAVFTVDFLKKYGGKSTQNRIGAILTQTLKRFAVVAQKFEDNKFRKLMLLPLDMFQASELKAMRKLITRDNFTSGFNEALDRVLAQFEPRQRPKKRMTFPDKYVIDDRPLFYQYGHEQHALVERNTPHTAICVLNADFRFGCRYDARRHYNVTKEKKDDPVSGAFISCHQQAVSVRPCSHINVFPNGFM